MTLKEAPIHIMGMHSTSLHHSVVTEITHQLWELTFSVPYQDADGIDNPHNCIYDAVDSLGIPYDGIGIGYGDGVVDNERYG